MPGTLPQIALRYKRLHVVHAAGEPIKRAEPGALLANTDKYTNAFLHESRHRL